MVEVGGIPSNCSTAFQHYTQLLFFSAPLLKLPFTASDASLGNVVQDPLRLPGLIIEGAESKWGILGGTHAHSKITAALAMPAGIASGTLRRIPRWNPHAIPGGFPVGSDFPGSP